MIAQITNGIKVSVQTEFQNEFSNAEESHFVFTYRILIENNSPNTIQVLRRQWFIHDLLEQIREVNGDGIVGQQPVLEPGESPAYVSGCNLRSGIGKMYGFYEMERVLNGALFSVSIPEFVMVASWRLN